MFVLDSPKVLRVAAGYKLSSIQFIADDAARVLFSACDEKGVQVGDALESIIVTGDAFAELKKSVASLCYAQLSERCAVKGSEK